MTFLQLSSLYRIIGDFNINSCTKSLKLNDILALVDLVQLNNFPNSYGNTHIKRENIHLIPEDLAHSTLSFKLTSQPRSSTSNFPCNINKKYNLKKANFPHMYQLQSATDWNFIFNEQDVTTSVSLFYKKFYNILNLTVPLFHVGTKNKF